MNAQLSIAFEQSIVEFAAARSHSFRDDFVPWLADNLHIWRRFEQEANKAYLRGRKHYSARTIIHYLRHETALAENSDAEWKVNNNVSPDLARLWLLVHPERDGFFELRGNEARAA